METGVLLCLPQALFFKAPWQLWDSLCLRLICFPLNTLQQAGRQLPIQGGQSPRRDGRARALDGPSGAAGPARSDPPAAALHAQELPRSRPWHSARSKSQHTHLREPRQQSFEKAKQPKWNTALFAGTSLLSRLEMGGSRFCVTLCKINSRAEQWKSYYATWIREPHVRLDLSHEYFTNISNTRHFKSHESGFLKITNWEFFSTSQSCFQAPLKTTKTRNLLGFFIWELSLKQHPNSRCWDFPNNTN